MKSSFRCSINPWPWSWCQDADTSYVHNLSLSFRRHVRYNSLSHPYWTCKTSFAENFESGILTNTWWSFTNFITEHICVEGVFHRLNWNLCKWSDTLNSGVIDQNIDLTILVDNFRHNFTHALFRLNIELLYKELGIFLQINHRALRSTRRHHSTTIRWELTSQRVSDSSFRASLMRTTGISSLLPILSLKGFG